MTFKHVEVSKSVSKSEGSVVWSGKVCPNIIYLCKSILL